jgi:hypothetical protein
MPLSTVILPLVLPTGGREPGHRKPSSHTSSPKNNNKSKAEYTNTQQYLTVG